MTDAHRTQSTVGPAGGYRSSGDASRGRRGNGSAASGRIASRLIGEVLLPAHEWLMRRRTFETLRELMLARQLSAEGIVELQQKKLRAILVHAGRRVPWYRDALRKLGSDAAVDDPWKILAALPLISRRDVQEQPDRFVSEGAKGLVPGRTSGSSGEPLRFFLDPNRIAADRAARIRAQLDWGIGPGERKVWLWGRPAHATWIDRLKTLRDRCFNERTLSAYHMNAPEMQQYVRVLKDWKPRSVTCYPTAAWRLCQFVLDQGLELRDADIAIWFTTGEMLQESHRKVIEAASGGRVANEYGLREAGFVAHECPCGTMHATAESVVLETVNPDGTASGDGLGEIVVTNLDNLGMPLLRYRTRDYGRIGRSRCACGWGTQSLTELAGRQSDLLIASDGTPVVGFALSRRFWDIPGVLQFRVVQDSISSTRVLVVGNDAFDTAARLRTEASIREVLGPDVKVSVERVAAIPADPSGKTGYIQSRIAGGGL